MSSIENILPEDIEKRSFEIIDEELKARNLCIPKEYELITKRVIHTTADFDYIDTLTYSLDVIKIIKEAISKGAVIVTDTNMALAGINKRVLKKYNGSAVCFMSDEDVALEAKRRKCTRAMISMERAAALNCPVIIVVGNAPTALINIVELIEKGFKPEAVIGVPVGFVNVVDSKEMIMDSSIPYIINKGRKGGSNVAAAICNAILYEMDTTRGGSL